MKYLDERGEDNFRPLDNSIRTSLRYQIEAEKQLEAYTNAYNKKFRSRAENDAIFRFIGSLIRGIYYLISGIVYLIIKRFNKRA